MIIDICSGRGLAPEKTEMGEVQSCLFRCASVLIILRSHLLEACASTQRPSRPLNSRNPETGVAGSRDDAPTRFSSIREQFDQPSRPEGNRQMTPWYSSLCFLIDDGELIVPAVQELPGAQQGQRSGKPRSQEREPTERSQALTPQARGLRLRQPGPE